MAAANFSVSQDAKLEVIQLLLDHMNIKMKPPAAPPDDNSAKLPKESPSSASSETETAAGQQQLGWQAIHHAAKFGLIGQLEELLQHGCDINAKIRGSGNTPLHVAALNDQLQVARVLLARGANKTLTNNSHYTAHQVAVIANNMNLAEFIASHGREPNTNSSSSSAPQADWSPPSLQRPSASKMIMKTQQQQQQQLSVQTTAHCAGNNSNHNNNNNNNNNVNSCSRLSVSASAQQLADNFATPRSELAEAHYQMQPNQQKRFNSSTCQSDSNKPIIQKQDSNLTQADRQMKLNPLTLDLANDSASGTLSSAPTTNTSGHSLLSIATPPPLVSTFTGANHLSSSNNNSHLHASNVSPSLSQRSSNTFNTSSSGVCCDGDNSSNNSRNGITIISIGAPAATSNAAAAAATNNLTQWATKDNRSSIHMARSPSLTLTQKHHTNSFRPLYNNSNNHHHHHNPEPNQTGIDAGSLDSLAAANSSDAIQSQEEEEASETSSSDELQSLMSERRPLFVGAHVRSITCYESGDPAHLQLRREDLVELLECPRELLQPDGQLPRLANKPLLFGRRHSDGTCGLFPSFCVRRARQRRPRRSTSMAPAVAGRLPTSESNDADGFLAGGGELTLGRGAHLRESQSSGSLAYGTLQRQLSKQQANPTAQVNFVEFEVQLSKVNEGFGFVLRGARIDPSTIKTVKESGAPAADPDRPARISVDERLMAANKLASLQYFSDIEPNSIAHQTGLRRGDFLVAVNEHDVRLWSHEQVVGMIRKSGAQVRLRIARVAPPPAEATRTLTRVKPEPPKRDPTTTLTRNKTARVKSMCVAPQIQQQQQPQQAHQAPASSGRLFDADKPLPSTPQNELNSFGSINRSVSSNLAHFSPVSASLVSSNQLDAQSIASISTLNSIQAPDSSSSTTTMTTVATTKPHHKAAGTPPKPSEQTTQAQAPIICTTQPLASYAQSIAETPKPSMGDLQLPPLPPPPPPPPLPDFSATPTRTTLNQQRRISATSQMTPFNPIQIDKSQLLRRRETLAVVSLSSSHEASPNEPTPICSVAAACAAAANSRRQRQQQQQQQQQQEEAKQNADANRRVEDGQAREVVPIKPVAQIEAPQDREAERAPNGKPGQLNKVPPPPKSAEASGCAQIRRTIEAQHGNQRASQQQQSATLGWRSSAQVIQESKMPSTGMSQFSQTLKISSTRQRMSILDYDSQMFASNETRQARPQEVREHARHQQFGDTSRQACANGNQSHRIQQTCRQVRDESQLDVERYLTQEQRQMLLLRQQQQQQQQHLQQQRLLQEQIRLQQQQRPHRCQHGHNHQMGQLAQSNKVCQQPSHYAYTSQLAANSHEHHSSGVTTRSSGPHHNHHHHAHAHSHQQQVQHAPDQRHPHHHHQHHHHNHSHQQHHQQQQQQLNRTGQSHPHGSAKFIDSFAGADEQNFRGFYWSAA